MKLRQFLLIVGVMAVIGLLMPSAFMQTTVHVHGYVKVGGTRMNDVNLHIVRQTNPPSEQFNTTHNDTSGNPGFYEFYISNGSYTIYASSGQNNGSYNFLASVADFSATEIIIAVPTPTPTPSTTVTPTPRPDGELGGMVVRNDSSTFTPMSANAFTVTPVPRPSRMPPPPGTITLILTPMPTPTPTPGILSNIYVWLVIGAAAVLAIAAATLLYLRRK